MAKVVMRILAVSVVVIIPHLFWECVFVQGFNINADNREVSLYRGPFGSLFGFSVLAHQSNRESWILVGAPKSNSGCQRGLPGPPGILYKCSTNGARCQQICLDDKGNEQYEMGYTNVYDKKDGQLLGVSLTRQPGSDGKVIVCGHRWINQYDAIHNPNDVYRSLINAPGICYSINAQLQTDSVDKIRPCIFTYSSYWWRCLSGASAQYAVDGKTLMLGAPGAIYNRGSVITINGSVISHYSHSVWGFTNHDQYPYLGYSLTSGHFTNLSAIEGVAGAPRFYDIGKVYIFDLHQKSVVNTIIGEPVNTYFGASVEAVDLNNDQWSDLLVGAPLYSSRVEKGCVYVYLNNKRGGLELQHKLFGSNVTGSRFGSAIESAGDLNQDGFQDVAIGAPFENDFGAVYIYNGGRNGIGVKFSQRISGETFGLRSFGSSLSGGLDLDGNSYPDLVVGAHQDNAAVYLKSRSVVNVKANLELSPFLRPRLTTGTQITVCLRYNTISNAHANTDFDYTVEADYHLFRDPSYRWSPRVKFQSSDFAFFEGKIQLQRDIKKCTELTLSLKQTARDFLSPIPVRLSYRLSNDSFSVAPVLNLLTANSINKQIGFASQCGSDNVCHSELQIDYTYSLLSGRNVIYIGADSVVYLQINVSNTGEEAHQAQLNITHPESAVYEAVQTLTSTSDFTVDCEPVSSEDNSLPYIDCSVGNPLGRNAKVLLQVRLDIGSLPPEQTVFNVSIAVTTSSNETNHINNRGLISLPVSVLADVGISGGSSPDQVIYKQDKDYKSQQYLENILDTVKKFTFGFEDEVISLKDDRASVGVGASVGGEASVGSGASLGDGPGDRTEEHEEDALIPGLGIVGDDEIDENLMYTSVNESLIGPEFTKQIEVANVGPGRVPYGSVVYISIPWHLKDDWLVFIKSVHGRDGIGACNTTDLLQRQYQELLKLYNSSSTRNEADEEQDKKKLDKQNTGLKTTIFNCETATCITFQCSVQPLPGNASAVIEINARIWKHSFLKASYGLTVIISNASVSVQNPPGLVFRQPDGGKPDNTTVQVTVSAEKISSIELPIPSWIIPVSVTSGILILVITTVSLAKLGFFRRKKHEELKRRLMEEKEEK